MSGENTCAQKHRGDVVHDFTAVLLDEFEDESTLGGLGLLMDRADPGRANDEPAGDDVEDADGRDGDVGRSGDAALGILRLLTVERGGLEADEARHREHQRDPDRATEDIGRAERLDGECSRPLIAGNDQVEDQQNGEFEHHQGAQHLGG